MIGSVEDVAKQVARAVMSAAPSRPNAVDVEVEHVGAVAGLVLGGVQALLVVAGDHRLAERLGAVGVGAFADHQEARVLVERHRHCTSDDVSD